MKHLPKVIFLSLLAIPNIHCNGGSSSSAPAPQAAAAAVYNISAASSQGVDDSGNMWIQINGSFSGNGDTVSLNCDGNDLNPELESDLANSIVVSVPAAGTYNMCNFLVQSGGISSNIFSVSISAIEILGASNEVLDASNSSKIDVELDGDFFVAPLINSTLSVQVTCDGGNTYFSPTILSQSFNDQTEENAVVVKISDPGFGQFEQCSFYVEDTFTDLDDNIITVPSPGFPTQIQGI